MKRILLSTTALLHILPPKGEVILLPVHPYWERMLIQQGVFESKAPSLE